MSPWPPHPLAPALARWACDMPPYRLSGTVVAALLNDEHELQALGDAAMQPPYKAWPEGPVLEIKPAPTLAGDGDAVRLPQGASAVSVSAQLGLVVARTACAVPASQALSHVGGYVLAAVLALPHESHYRPAARQRMCDGFCPLGAPSDAAGLPAADELASQVRLEIDGQPQALPSATRWRRDAAHLLAAVSDFMTLHPGDVLLLGGRASPPRARAGQRLRVHAAGLGSLSFTLAAQEAA